jgi:hypothetical protein
MSGEQALDRQECAVWRAENSNVARGFGQMAINRNVERQLGKVDQTEIAIWICPDGYIHQVVGRVDGHDPARPADKAAVELKFHLYDFDAPITITAPEGAQEFRLKRPPTAVPTATSLPPPLESPTPESPPSETPTPAS